MSIFSNQRFTSPRVGAAVFFLIGVTALWICAIIALTSESPKETFDVAIRPGAVSYGTHSSATVPLVSAPEHRAVTPLISGNTVRSYARSGHASAPASNTSGQIHTTSSATVKSVGSGSGGGGGVVAAVSGGSHGSSSRGIQNAGAASVSMPSLAWVTPAYSSDHMMGEQGEQAERMMMHRAKKDGPGTGPSNPGSEGFIPVGNTPWLLMLLFAIGYGIFLKRKSHQA